MSEPLETIAIVGATGAVGREALAILESRRHPASRLRLYGSRRSAGSRVEYLGGSIRVGLVERLDEQPHDAALLCADAPTAGWVRTALAQRATVIIDNSSAFRMEQDVPLVIPEVNGDLLGPRTRVIANPNCSTIMLLAALDPLRREVGISGVTVTTYQAVSGAGQAGIDELHAQTRAMLAGAPIAPGVFPTSCAFNVFEHESPIDPGTGFNGEETKMVNETRRIWCDPSLSVLPTCVRVPVERAHAQSVIVELGAQCSIEQIRALLDRPGITLWEAGAPLTPRDAAGTDGVHIGRIRFDPGGSGRRVLLWICCDQIRKGAALNAIQIMDLMNNRLLPPAAPPALPGVQLATPAE